MEKKYFVKSTGEEVTIGSTIVLTKTKKVPYGKETHTFTINVTEDNIGDLIEDNIIIVKDKEEKKAGCKKLPMDLMPYIESFGSQTGMSRVEAFNYLRNLYDIYPHAAFSILLRIIAKRIDRQYESHISEADEIWVICSLDGEIHKVNKNSIVNYNNFAAFRSKEDAKFACKILISFLTDMYE